MLKRCCMLSAAALVSAGLGFAQAAETPAATMPAVTLPSATMPSAALPAVPRPSTALPAAPAAAPMAAPSASGPAAATAASAPVAADAASAPVATSPTGSLDNRVQDVKSDVIKLNRDLLVLEEELLFPANTQVALFVSMDVGKTFELDSVQVKLDDKVVANYL